MYKTNCMQSIENISTWEVFSSICPSYFVIYMFNSNNPSSGDINSSNLSCFCLILTTVYVNYPEKDI